MAPATTNTKAEPDKAGTAAAKFEGDHDRVVMLSRRPDGSPDQINPEVIGDKDFAIAAAKEQLAQQAVSAVDVAIRGASDAGTDLGSEPDPEVQAIKDAHDAAAASAEKKAEAEINALHQGLGA